MLLLICAAVVVAAVAWSVWRTRSREGFANGYAVQLTLDYDDSEARHPEFQELKDGLSGISFVTYNVLSADGQGAAQRGNMSSLPDLRIIRDNATVAKYAGTEPWAPSDVAAWVIENVPGRGVSWRP